MSRSHVVWKSLVLLEEGRPKPCLLVLSSAEPDNGGMQALFELGGQELSDAGRTIRKQIFPSLVLLGSVFFCHLPCFF